MCTLRNEMGQDGARWGSVISSMQQKVEIQKRIL